MNTPIKAFTTPTKMDKVFFEYLHKLVTTGELDLLKSVIETQDVDLARYDKEAYTSILYAGVCSGNKELVQYLVDKGANVNAQTPGHETALHQAAWKGAYEIVNVLVENGAKLNIAHKTSGGLSPLHCAAENGHISIVKYLLEKGAKLSFDEQKTASPLLVAAYKGHSEVFLFLAQKAPAEYDWEAIFIHSLIGGNLEIVKYIVEKGVDINKWSAKWHAYPIEEAAADKSVSNKNACPIEVTKFLVRKGAKVANINDGNVTEWAAEHCSESMKAYLAALSMDK